MQAVILAGGLGTRMREETEFKPKPMVEIGGKPILWHIMMILSAQGIKEFIICLGYRGQDIKRYFLDLPAMNNDFSIRIGQEPQIYGRQPQPLEDWDVSLVNTGALTPTGGRLLAVKDLIKSGPFLLTYGDGLADVDLTALRKKHDELKTTVTITTTRPRSRFGVVDVDSSGRVHRFLEKPEGTEIVNIGYMLATPEIFKYLKHNSALEQEPLRNLASEGKLGSYFHSGFWQPMDTIREAEQLNEIWDTGTAPWKIWSE